MRLKFQCNKEVRDLDLAMMITALNEAKQNGEPIFFSHSTELVIGEKIPRRAVAASKEKREHMIKEIISHLNTRTGKRYSHSAKATRSLIQGRISDGATVDDFKTVIENKVRAWKGDPKMDQYLRPSTLFSAQKFEAYLNEKSEKDLERDAFSGFDEALESIK